MIGRVLKSTGSWYEVVGEDQKKYACRVRGKMRLEGYRESNPIAVGDQVKFEIDNSEGIISEILARTNHMLRQSVKRTGHASVLAANIDQVLVVATIKQPRTSLGFIDRVLVSAESFRIPQVIVFNKKDLLTEEEIVELENLIGLYQSIGVNAISISAQHDTSLEEISKILQGKVTLIAGHSGVGKSTMLNRLSPEIGQSTAAISDYSEKGTHTTTFAEMFPLDATTYIIDTPGIKEWGLVDMEQQEISDYFPEMREIRLGCKFGARCLHINEPRCAVKEGVENNLISASRYNSYLSMVLGEDNRK
ncbi:MAG TPA: ribosome small subunit-dependent GTPase A [Cyclobacteriaceae bacterium]|nr:ribosome small subunit-dependent GTPase A [Cyclobacteriaceae bacterium]